jgi:hypothetical protein
VRFAGWRKSLRVKLEKELKSKKAMAEYRARGIKIKKNEIGQGEVSML